MSRSKRKSPIRGITSADSEKEDKVAAHRKFRRTIRIALDQGADILPHVRELSNQWAMAKDGKTMFDPRANPKDMRK